MNHTHIYCPHLDDVDPREAIDAIHEALLQLDAQVRGVENLDHGPVIKSLKRQLRIAGHPGYQPPEDPRFIVYERHGYPHHCFLVVVKSWSRGATEYGCLMLDRTGDVYHDDCNTSFNLGRKIAFSELPEACRKAVEREACVSRA